jgi:hypothetical protein
MRLPEVASGIRGVFSELFFDSKQLVVLGESLRSARSSSLDLQSSQSNSQVSNVGIFRFSRSVGGHHAPSSILGHEDSFNGFGDGSDLVHLQQEGLEKREKV